MEKQERTSLANLARGAAIEKFDDQLQRALDHIIDPNTPVKGTRTVTLTVAITTDDERRQAYVQIGCEAKLPGTRPEKTLLYLGKDGRGRAVAFEFNPAQLTLSEAPPRPVLVPDKPDKVVAE